MGAETLSKNGNFQAELVHCGQFIINTNASHPVVGCLLGVPEQFFSAWIGRLGQQKNKIETETSS